MTFKKYLRGLSGASASASTLAFKKIFRMHCKFFFVYLVIKEPDMSKATKKRAKIRVLAVEASENLPGLFKSEDLDS